MEEIGTRVALIAYLRTLLAELEEIGDDYDPKDVYLNSIRGWYNLSLWGFLEAMTAALEDHTKAGGAWPAPGGDDPRIWQAIAAMLGAGKGYE